MFNQSLCSVPIVTSIPSVPTIPSVPSVPVFHQLPAFSLSNYSLLFLPSPVFSLFQHAQFQHCSFARALCACGTAVRGRSCSYIFGRAIARRELRNNGCYTIYSIVYILFPYSLCQLYIIFRLDVQCHVCTILSQLGKEDHG